jgi:hypothetical protein
VDKTPCIIITCCVSQNFCELHGIPKLIVCDIRECNDPLIGFDMVNCLHEGEQTIIVGELLKNALFASWLECHLIVNKHVF